jgi:hypothetical protein
MDQYWKMNVSILEKHISKQIHNKIVPNKCNAVY